MLRNYLRVALRNLQKEKIYTLVNVIGLAAGIACCLLIALYARHEWSFDRFHEKADHIYRAWGREDWGEGRTFFYTFTPIPLAEALEAHLPEVEETVRIGPVSGTVARGPARFTEDVRMVDASFFDVFDFPVVSGTGMFSNPNTTVITAETARKYFGADDPVGQTLAIEIGGEEQDFVVEGVAAAAPANSSIQFDLLIPFAKAPDVMGEAAMTAFFNISVETYVLLQGNLEAAEAKLPAMVTAVLGDAAARSGYQVGLQPLTEIHLDPEFPVGIEPVSDPVYGYILVGVAALVLLIASINFITLSVGQSARRGAEVGVRKTLGANRAQLMRQFWGEAVVVVALAVVFGVALAHVALPLFNDLSAQQLSLSLDAVTLLVLGGLVLVVGTTAGLYPAVVMASFRPADALRGRVRSVGDRSLLRRGLIVVQFSISILLIVATLFVVRQLDYLRELDLGFDREAVVVLRTGAGPQVAERLLGELSGQTAVRSAAYSAFPMNDGWARFGFNAEDGAYAEFMANIVSPEFLSTMGIDVVAGRDFSRERTADSTAIIVNEAFVRAFGLGTPQEAVGQRIPSATYAEHEIVGVVPDFYFESLYSAVRPAVLARTGAWLFEGSNDVNMPSPMTPDVSIRLATGDLSASMDALEATWAEVGEGRPFEVVFLDAALDNRYRQEERLSRIVGAGATLAILIACMGVFGLAALTVVRRRKEIGVRKVLGASVTGILLLLARDFALLVGVAFVVATPVAYLVVIRWLDHFAVRTSVGPGVFMLAGAIALGLAVTAVSYQSVRAALADPVKSLRYE